jgi:hypothetical protein
MQGRAPPADNPIGIGRKRMQANQEMLRRIIAMMRAASGAVPDEVQTPLLGIVVDPSATSSELLDLFVAEYDQYWNLPFARGPIAKDLAAGRAILALAPDQQLELLHQSLQRVIESPRGHLAAPPYALCACADMLLGQTLPCTEEDLRRLLRLLVGVALPFVPLGPLFQRFLGQLDRYAGGRLPVDVLESLPPALEAIRNRLDVPTYGRLFARVTALSRPSEAGLPEPNEPWSAAMLASLRAMDSSEFAGWQRLLAHTARAEQSKPTAKWSREAASLVEQIGYANFRARLLAWFAEIATPGEKVMSPRNAQLVKGLAWACGPYEDAELSCALAHLVEALLTWLTRFPGLDWRCLKGGNACLYALSLMPGDEPVAQLSRLNLRLKGRQLQDSTNKALTRAVERRGMTREDLEELTAPIHGLDAQGSLRTSVGDVTAEIAITGSTSVEWRWLDAAGRRLKAPPASLQTDHKAEIAALKRQVADIRSSLAAQRLRLERLPLAERVWSLPAWQERYDQHPLLGQLARRLIWRFQPPEREAVLAIHAGGDLVDVEGRPLDGLPQTTRVSLWHPLGTAAADVLRWRRFLEQRAIVQPFKQAHRELYAITKAERDGRTRSDRFAAHIIRQQQFKALCDERAWRYKIQGRFVHGDGRATRAFDACDVQAVFFVAPAGDDPDNGALAPYTAFLETNKLQFSRLDGAEMALGEVPSLVFSETMRDLDLFVGVCSIGNDPSWNRPGGTSPYRDYWRRCAFAELSEAAAQRRGLLEAILPNFRIGSRCTIEGRFLVVRGNIRTYKIHIGSGNVLMSPNDAFLAVERAPAIPTKDGDVFLPFEGDSLLTRILSTATALAADAQIADRAIRDQIRASA